jgi:hypothetical protein
MFLTKPRVRAILELFLRLHDKNEALAIAVRAHAVLCSARRLEPDIHEGVQLEIGDVQKPVGS